MQHGNNNMRFTKLPLLMPDRSALRVPQHDGVVCELRLLELLFVLLQDMYNPISVSANTTKIVAQ